MTLPRVTQILQAVGLSPDFSGVDPDVLEAARARGTAVHSAIEASAYGYLESTAHEWTPYLVAYERFLTDSGSEHIASEFEVVHPAWGYVGHPDRLCWLRGRRTLLDWKCTEAPDLRAAGLQLAGYRLAFNAENPATPVEDVAVVQLRGDGTYRYLAIADLAHHEQVFLAAVVVYQAQRMNGGRA